MNPDFPALLRAANVAAYHGDDALAAALMAMIARLAS